MNKGNLTVPVNFSLEGKIALITGASSGFGEHFANILSEAGATVVLAARRVGRLESLSEYIQKQGGKAFHVEMDVTSSESVKKAFDIIEKEVGTIDILINNAGVADPKRWINITEESWDFILDTNLKGAWMVASETCRRLIAAEKPGSIVNIASILGLRVETGQSHYAASKAGLIQMTKAMALELVRHKIRVNALAPGYIKTEMNEEYYKSERGKENLKKVPMRRLGRLDELNGPLLLLASDASSFMTGSVIEVDGGHLVSSL